MTHLLESSTKQHFITEDDRDVLSNVSDSSRDVLETQLLQGKTVASCAMYTEIVRKFAMNLHFYSPRAYAYVRESISGNLPHPRTISRWYSSTNCDPGFIALRCAVEKAAEQNQILICNLVFDEMALRECIEWAHGKVYGFVDIGSGVHHDVKATLALVFMIVCINRSWKLPIGYFPISSLSSEQKFHLLEHCIGLLLETGIVLLGVTFDGASNNVTLTRRLGCNIKENKSNYSFRLQDIPQDFCIFPDACHMVKLVRNAFAELSPLLDDSGNEINWKFLLELGKIQDSEGLYLGNKIKMAHIYFQQQKMKLRLATQLFSKSVADAIDYCRKELKLPQFVGSEATSKFILIINDAFDMLNSRKATDIGYKPALSCKNYTATNEYALEICDYLRSIKLSSGEYIVDHRRCLGFSGMIVGLRNLSLLYQKILVPNILTYMPTYKLSQDHLELFFSSVRCRLGRNNNPSVRQLKAAYTQLLSHCQIREGGIGNAVPLENISILRCSPLEVQSPTELINISTDRYRMIEPEEEESVSFSLEEEIFLSYHTIPNQLNEYSESVVEYIAGFIVFKLQKSLHCQNCLSALESESTFSSLISYKSLGYLKTPSTSVKKICQVTEKMIRSAIVCSKPHTSILNSKFFQNIVITVQRELLGYSLFVDLSDHFKQTNHFGNLIKVIAEKYLNIRFHSMARQMCQKNSLRSLNNRRTLFQDVLLNWKQPSFRPCIAVLFTCLCNFNVQFLMYIKNCNKNCKNIILISFKLSMKNCPQKKI